MQACQNLETLQYILQQNIKYESIGFFYIVTLLLKSVFRLIYILL